jgi:gamma-glutamyltranspeptidase/glutathione hydrolase
MGFSKVRLQSSVKVGHGRQRQCVAALLTVSFVTLSFVLGGCFGGKGPEQGTLGFVPGFLGGVAADEPRAATVGRDVLSAGGTAVDAAVAVFFTMAVTRSSVAGWAAASVPSSTMRASGSSADFTALPGVPAVPRAMFAYMRNMAGCAGSSSCHPAETLARFGFPVSRGFARDLAAAATTIAQSPELARLYRQADGGLADEGAFLQQLDLAATLAVLRRAPGDFYAGAFARQYVEAAQARHHITADALRAYTRNGATPSR